MAIILPNKADAKTQSQANIADFTAEANAAFIATATALILTAVGLNFYSVFPFVTPYLDIATITTYFEGYGYTVTFPVCPNSPYNPCFVAGFPEVLPPGYRPWNCGCDDSNRCRIKISWIPPSISPGLLLLETGYAFLLENGVDGIELE